MPSNDDTFHQLFAMSADAMMLLDESGFLYCNEATLRIFDCADRDEFCTKHPSDISPLLQPCGAPSRELADEAIAQAIEDGQNRFEWVHRRLSGECFDAEVLLSPAVWEGRSVLQAIVRDISESKRLQRDLERALRKSETAAAAKSDFLEVMSHGIRTPIHGIIGLQEILLTSSLSGDQREHAELALDSAKALLATINNVLDFSKIDAHKLQLETIDFSADRLLERVFLLLAPGACAKGVSVDVQSETQGLNLVGDEARIRQVLLNLVGNAIKFTHQGGVTISSWVEPSGPGQVLWRVSVEDTGIGMSREQQLAVLETFRKAGSSITQRYEGTGLGLSISHSLAELMGGSIDLHSEPGVGSTFTLDLPMLLGAPDADDAEEFPADPGKAHGGRVLVVEDNPVNQKIIARQLQRLGIDSDLAVNGEKGVQAFQAAQDDPGNSGYALVLMDLQMPVMNGLEAARELRERGCLAPMIALTADVLQERRDECKAAGMNGFLPKPFQFDDLVRVLDQYMPAGAGSESAARRSA